MIGRHLHATALKLTLRRRRSVFLIALEFSPVGCSFAPTHDRRAKSLYRPVAIAMGMEHTGSRERFLQIPRPRVLRRSRIGALEQRRSLISAGRRPTIQAERAILKCALYYIDI